MTTPSRNTENLTEARREIAARAERITALERALQLLSDLHDVSKLLTSFESVETTVPQVLSVVARSLALRSAIVVLGTTGAPRLIEWKLDAAADDELHAAKAHATNTYDYLLNAHSEVPIQAANERTFVVLPLTVDRSIFGALQLEGMSPLDERDLTFMNAIVNQLAIAIDRAAAITAQRVAAENEQNLMNVLADLGAGLVAAGDSPKALAALARSVVPRIADLCVIDLLREDGTLERAEVLFAKERPVVEVLKACAPATDVANVIASRAPLLVTDVRIPDGSADGAFACILDAAGITSMIIVPLQADGSSIGAMTLAIAGSNRRYTTKDLAFGLEIADRAARGIENIRLHEQTQQATKELRRAVQLREDVLAIVSHDLRNPLGAVELSARLLLERHGNDPRSNRQLETIRRASGRMTNLINDLLDMANIQTGKLSLDRKPTDATTLVTEILDDFEPAATEKGITIERTLLVKNLLIDVDHDRITQVFGNLLGNATKFCRAGDVIRVRMTAIGGNALFVVEDTGPGIPEAELPHLFEPYWSATRHKRQGTGLGLYICKGIVEAHGGRLWVESTVDVGTRFFFMVPLADVDASSK